MADETNPFRSMIQMLEQFKVPGIDMSSVIEGGRKDVEALLDANKSAYESLQAVARKQTEILTQAMHSLQSFAKNAAAGGAAAPDVSRQAEFARNALQKALADMTDLAEMVHKSQADAMTGISQRATQSLQDLKNLVKPK
jgi:phasin family protein